MGIQLIPKIPNRYGSIFYGAKEPAAVQLSVVANLDGPLPDLSMPEDAPNA